MVLKLKAVDRLNNAQADKLAGLYETSASRLIQQYKAEGLEAITGIRHHHGNRYMTREEEIAFLKNTKPKAKQGMPLRWASFTARTKNRWDIL